MIYFSWLTGQIKSVITDSIGQTTPNGILFYIIRLGAFLKINKDVTRGDKLPEILQFQVKMGQSTTFSSRVNKTEQAALASLKEKVKLMHKARLINW